MSFTISKETENRLKALCKDFAPRIVPEINGLNSNYIENIRFPIYLQPIPKGISLFIRSGNLRLSDGTIVRNLNFKEQLQELIVETKKLKVTLECIITSNDSSIDKINMLNILTDFSKKAENLKCTIIDMVFERIPEALNFSARASSLPILFRKEKIGKFAETAPFIVAHNNKELMEYISSYIIVNGYDKFLVASPKSKYKFGEIEDLFEGDGGIASLDSNTIFEGTLVNVIPKIISIRGKDTYIAEKIIVKYNETEIKIPIKDSTILSANIYENRMALKGHKVIFSGLLLPEYTYPKYRTFIKFQK